MRAKLLLLTVPLLGLLAACGAGVANGVGTGTSPAGPNHRVTQSGAAKSSGLQLGVPAAPAADLPPLPSSQHLEIDESLSLQIPRGKFQAEYAQVLGIVTSQRGYLSASNTDTNVDGPRSGTFTFQVPVDGYLAVVGQLHQLGRYSEHLTSQPHDAQYVDLQARLKSAQTQLAALNSLLSKAASIGDIIAIEQQIAPVQQQIEEYEGQLQYLDSLTQYATVTVTLTEKGAAPAPPTQPGFGDTFRQVLRNLAALANGFILVVGTLLPFLLIGAAAFLTRRRWLPALART